MAELRYCKPKYDDLEFWAWLLTICDNAPDLDGVLLLVDPAIEKLQRYRRACGVRNAYMYLGLIDR